MRGATEAQRAEGAKHLNSNFIILTQPNLSSRLS